MWFLQGVTIESAIMRILAVAIIIMLILPLHEFAHGWVAYKLGDNTAKYSGRLTLNPLEHIDVLGSIAILLFGFGWAKPVPINPRNFKNPKSGMAITALAGPLSNILAAFLGLIIFNIIKLIVISSGANLPFMVSSGLSMFFNYYVSINVGLAVFNLIPLPPLDGSKILGAFLPDRILYKYYQHQQVIMIVVFALLFLGILSIPLSFLQFWLQKSLVWLANWPFGF